MYEIIHYLLLIFEVVRLFALNGYNTKLLNLNFRKRYTKSLQITHTYGDKEDEDEELVDEVEATAMTEHAIANGTAPTFNIPDVVNPPPPGATVNIGGKKCKWCGSNTHSRKSHKDCPHNTNRISQSAGP